MRIAPKPSGSIVEIHAFPGGFVPSHGFFRLSQPRNSAAGRAGYCTQQIFAGAQGARALQAACGAYLMARKVAHA
jgi:hypothetical protein